MKRFIIALVFAAASIAVASELIAEHAMAPLARPPATIASRPHYSYGCDIWGGSVDCSPYLFDNWENCARAIGAFRSNLLLWHLYARLNDARICAVK